MKTIVLASHNQGKVKEFQKILGPFGYEVKSVSELGHEEEPVEDGKTYAENAYIKAKFYHDILKMPVISDDSGVEIYAMGDHYPGIYSARYRSSICEEFGDTDDDVNQHILDKMKGITNRDGQYVCVICLIDENDETHYFEGLCPGKILEEITGDHGFGYDPIFYSYECKMPFGLASEDEKNEYSHRGKAIRKLIEHFKQKDAQ